MPKKTKNTKDKSQASSESDPLVLSKKTGKRQIGRRATTSKKPRKVTSVKERVAGTTAHISATPQAEPPVSADVLEDTIRLRAYFISERRRRFALPADAESDWLEAKRQLLAEERR